MRLPVLALIITAAGCSTNPDFRIPRAAAEAMTGSPWTLTAAASLTIEATGSGVDPQSGPYEISFFQQALNLKRGANRQREARPGQPFLEQALAPAERLHHPLGFLAAAFGAKPQFANARTEGGLEAIDLISDGQAYSLFVDSSSLPVKIVSRAGTTVRETSFEKYVDVHGYRLPSRIITRVDGKVVRTLNVTRQYASPDPVALPAQKLVAAQ